MIRDMITKIRHSLAAQVALAIGVILIARVIHSGNPIADTFSGLLGLIAVILIFSIGLTASSRLIDRIN